jgi:hypothetical protein
MSDTAGDPNTGNDPSIVMNSLPTTVQQRYQAQVAYWTAAVTRLDALYASISNSTLSEYNLGSGDGRTMGKRHDIEAVGRELDRAQQRLRFFEQKLYGRGVMVLRFRPR